MEKKTFCKKCAQFWPMVNIQTDEYNNSSTTNSLCPSCRTYLITYRGYKNAESSANALLNLPNQSIYIHLNEETLNIFKQSDHDTNKNNYSDKNVLLIACGTYKRVIVLQSLLKHKFNKIVCLSRDKEWGVRFFDDWITAEYENLSEKEATLSKVEEYMRVNQIEFHAIFTHYDYSVEMTSYLAEHFKLPTIPLEVCSRIKNKYEMRKACVNLNISAPHFFGIKAEERAGFVEAIKRNEVLSLKSEKGVSFGFPLIVKNPNGVSKDFVQKCESMEDLANSILKSIQISSKMNLLIEEFYDGHEIDLEILVQDNKVKFLAISDNTPPIEPYFYEQGGACPSILLSQQEQLAIRSLASKWVSQLSIQNACLHFEARCRPQSLYKDRPIFDENNNVIDQNYFLMPIEINLRLAGAETWSMIKSVYDVDLFEEHLNLSLGLKLDEVQLDRKTNNPRFKCISKDIHPARNVILNSIRVDLEKLAANDNAVEICIFRSPGDKLTGEDYVGWLTVKSGIHETNETLLSSFNEVMNLVQIELVDY